MGGGRDEMKGEGGKWNFCEFLTFLYSFQLWHHVNVVHIKIKMKKIKIKS
jgi:hypothetical protein